MTVIRCQLNCEFEKQNHIFVTWGFCFALKMQTMSTVGAESVLATRLRKWKLDGGRKVALPLFPAICVAIALSLPNYTKQTIFVVKNAHKAFISNLLLCIPSSFSSFAGTRDISLRFGRKPVCSEGAIKSGRLRHGPIGKSISWWLSIYILYCFLSVNNVR